MTTMDELELLRRTVGLTEDDDRALRMAGEVLADQAGAMVDTWRGVIAQEPHLARYSAKQDGSPNPEYAVASKPRFTQWILDLCNPPYDQSWLDYQYEIGLRHSRAKKNVTDQADSLDHIPLRYILALLPEVLLSAKDFLARKGHSAAEVDRMHQAWVKAVVLSVTLWTRPYTKDADW
jgi:hypothetical protein